MWATDLREFFKTIQDDYFIYTVEDHFIVYPVNFIILNDLIRMTRKYNNVGRIGLTNDNKGRPFDILERRNKFDIIENRQDVDYRLSLLWCIWNREYILKYMENGQDPHDFEIKGSKKAKNDGWKILSTYGEYAIHHTQAIRKGKLNAPLNFHFINDNRYLDSNIIEEMKTKGLI